MVVHILVVVNDTLVGVQSLQGIKLSAVLRVYFRYLVKFFSQSGKIIPYAEIKIHEFGVDVIYYRFAWLKMKKQCPATKERFYISSSETRNIPHDVWYLLRLSASIFYYWFHWRFTLTSAEKCMETTQIGSY